MCVIDSVQTLHAAELSGAPARSARCARSPAAHARGQGARHRGRARRPRDEGGRARRPRVLEHLVDSVLQFEGERERTYRTLRALKNRFGSTNEVGVFEMHDGGLVEVADASARFVAAATRAPGSVVLARDGGLAAAAGRGAGAGAPTELVPPRRVANGVDRNRLALGARRARRATPGSRSGADVFVNVVGGVRVEEPGATSRSRWPSQARRAGIALGGEPAARRASASSG